MSSKAVANLSAYGGITLLIAFGYFATISGVSSAFHSFALALAIGAAACGRVYSNTRSKTVHTQTAQAEIGGSSLRKISTYVAITAATLFFIEVNLPNLRWREVFGGLSLAMYVISLAMGVVKLNGRSNSINKSPLS